MGKCCAVEDSPTPFAFYNHCVAHRMSLCASQTARKIQNVASFFDTVDSVVKFFRSSPKRKHLLGRSLPKPGDTRWLSRDTAIEAIDSSYEVIGTVLFEMALDGDEKSEIRTTARGLCTKIQHIKFVFLLKLYRKIFSFCAPIIKMMQKPTLDAVQLSSMLEDFQDVLEALDFNDVWEDTMNLDPEIPAVRKRAGWRGIQGSIDGSTESWKRSLVEIAAQVTSRFTDQISWRFENLNKFKWMNLIHPSKFEARKNASSQEQKQLIAELRDIYPTAVPDPLALEHCLNVLYNSREISVLLDRVTREPDAFIAKKKDRRRRLVRANEEPPESRRSEREAVEEDDLLEVTNEVEVEVDIVTEGKPSIQDLLTLLKKTELQDALPQAMTVLKLAAVTPLTSVHCERVFSRMKRVVSSSRSTMLQKRKEMLVFLQVEHKTLRWLAEQPQFKTNVVERFKAFNQRRSDRFSKK